MLDLHVGLQGDSVRNVVVQAAARGVDGGVGAEIVESLSGADDNNEAAIVVVDFASADEEVAVRMEPVDRVFDLYSTEEVLLAGDVAIVYRVGTADLDRGLEVAREIEEGEVGACGDSEIFATLDVDERASDAGEGGELQCLSSSG